MSEASGSRTELINGMQIRRASSQDLDIVYSVIRSSADWLKGQGMDHWDKYYTREKVVEKLKSQEVYLAFDKDNVVGTITFDTNPVSYYEERDLANFSDPEAKALYVTALAVLPEQQKKGIAGSLMKFAEDRAKEKGVGFVRFDCRAMYIDLVKFYRNRDYKVVGAIIDYEDNNEPYFLMEKEL